VLGDDLPEWGVVDARAGQAAVTAIEVATKAAMDQQIAGIVTGPINKEAVWKSGRSTSDTRRCSVSSPA
jgi:4-hydroxy-L-threonine phosphate dehydrogenase PdxA